jgi:Domain of unknown function (DUF6249)
MENSFVCAGFIGFFFLLFAFIVAMRYLNYRETMGLAEKGLVRPPRESSRPRNGGSKAVLVWGIILASIGLALMLGLWPLGFTSIGRGFPLGFGPWMLFALLPLFFGLGLVLIYVLGRPGAEKQPDSTEPPGQAPLPSSPEPETPADLLPPQS